MAEVKPMTATIAKYAGIAGLIVLAVMLVSWWQASSADARYKELEELVQQQKGQLDLQRQASQAALSRYDELSKRHAQAEEERTRQLSLLISQLHGLQADNARLRGELTRRVEDTRRQVADVAGTPDADLAAAVQRDLRTIKPDADFRWGAGEWFEADRPAAEGIRESFLRMELAEFTVSNQKEQIEGLDGQVANLNGQLNIERVRAMDCTERVNACADSLEAIGVERTSLEEVIRLREEQIAQLKRKAFWGRFKRWGFHAAAFGAGYAVGKAGSNP